MRVEQKSEQEQNTKTSSAEKNVRAFLRLIRYAETGKDDSSAYYVLYGGGTFKNNSAHPLRKAVTRWGKKSRSAGAYQIQYSTWEGEKKHGLVSDFTPASQDKIARDKLRSRGALAYIETGNIEKAIPKLRDEWTSLPGAKQAKKEMTMEKARTLFNQYVADQK